MITALNIRPFSQVGRTEVLYSQARKEELTQENY